MSRVKESMAPEDYESNDLVLANIRSARHVVKQLWADHKLDDDGLFQMLEALQAIHHDYSCGVAGAAK